MNQHISSSASLNESKNGQHTSGASQASETAHVKLAQVLDPSFTRYALRFMNFAEYGQLMKGAFTPSGEAWVSWPGKGLQGAAPDPVSFQKYLTQNSQAGGGWLSTISRQTEWDYSSHDLETCLLLRSSLAKAHKTDPEEQQHPRQGPFRKFAELIKKEAQSLSWYSDGVLRAFSFVLKEGKNAFEKSTIAADPYLNRTSVLALKELALTEYDRISTGESGLYLNDDTILKQFTCARPEVNPEMAAYVFDQFLQAHALIGFDAIDHAARFLDDPDSFKPTEVEELIQRASYSPKWPAALGGRVNCAPYHLLVVFSENSVGTSRPYQWQDFQHVKPESVLAAVSILPNDTLLEAICKASRSARDLAHPIFDMDGKIKFPASVATVLEGPV